MTWDGITTDGSGKIELRLSIEGITTQFVSAYSMEVAASSGVAARKVGLIRSGINLEENADILRAQMSGGSLTFQIKDIALAATATFATRPTKTTWLTATFDIGDSAATVGSTTGWTTSDIAYMNKETFLISAIPASDEFTLTRAQYDSVEQKHYSSDGEKYSMPAVTNAPYAFTGRKVILYAYGEGDSLTGDGTIVWRGSVSGEPSLDVYGTTWSLPCESISKLLQNTIGLDANVYGRARGVYYPWNGAMRLRVGYYDGASYLASASVVDQTVVATIGFWETQEDFVASLNDALQTLTSAWDVVFGAEPIDDTKYKITARIQTAATPSIFALDSVIDTLGDDYSPNTSNLLAYGSNWLNSNDEEVDANNTFAAGEVYYAIVNATVPRGVFGHIVRAGDVDTRYQAYRAAYPENRIYISDIDLTDVTSATIDFGYYFGTNNPDMPGGEYQVTTDTTSQYVQTVDDPRGGGITYGTGDYPKVTPNYTDMFASNKNIGDLMSWITTYSAAYANSGLVPLITTSEFDSSGFATLVFRAIHGGGAGYRNNRHYSFPKPVKLNELLAAEMQLLGLYLGTSETGRMQARQLAQVAQTQNVDFAITASNTITSGGFAGYEVAPYGMVNTITIYTGYDPVADDWLGSKYPIKDRSAFGFTQTTNGLDIKPRSSDPIDNPITASDAVSIAQPLFSTFAVPYVVLSFNVPFSVYTQALVGNTCSFVSNQLPDTDGTRGYTNPKRGVVIGRRFDFGNSYGTIRVLHSLQQIAGYTPTMRINSASGALTSWTVVLKENDPVVGISWLPSGYTNADDWFTAGDQIAFTGWDSTAPSRVTGEVVSVSGNNMTVTLDAAATLSSGTWILSFNVGTDAGISSIEMRYAYIAGSDLLIDFPTPTNARTFG